MNDIASHLTAILGRLCLAVGAFVAVQSRGPHRAWIGTQFYSATVAPNALPLIPPETWLLLTQRISRLAGRFRTLFARYQVGTLPTPRPPRPAAPRERAPYPRLPARRGWVNARIAEIASCAGMLDMLLQRPELRQFAAAAPQAGRLLRPLCRMLALDIPEYLRLPPRPRPCAPKVGPSAAEPSNPPPGTPDRPIPRYVLAAARAWRSKMR